MNSTHNLILRQRIDPIPIRSYSLIAKRPDRAVLLKNGIFIRKESKKDETLSHCRCGKQFVIAASQFQAACIQDFVSRPCVDPCRKLATAVCLWLFWFCLSYENRIPNSDKLKKTLTV